MTITAQSVIRDAQETLMDAVTGRRWPASQLVRYLNTSQRLIAAARPDTVASSVSIPLIGGHAQVLPATYMALLEIEANTADTSAITEIQREELNHDSPGWRSVAQVGIIEHFMVDQRQPRRFDVYPPALVGTIVQARVAAYPIDIGATSGDGLLYSTVSGNIALPDEFERPLMHLVCYMAYLKDAEYASNGALAKTHLEAAVAQVGEQLRSQVDAMPKTGQDPSA